MQKSLKQDIHLGFWRNATLIPLPNLIVLSKAEFVGQIADEVWREIGLKYYTSLTSATMRPSQLFVENVLKRFPAGGMF